MVNTHPLPGLQARDVEAAAAFCEKHLGLRRAPASPPGAVLFATEPIPFAGPEGYALTAHGS